MKQGQMCRCSIIPFRNLRKESRMNSGMIRMVTNICVGEQQNNFGRSHGEHVGGVDDLKAIEMNMHARGTGSITQGVNAAHDKGHTALCNHMVVLMQWLKRVRMLQVTTQLCLILIRTLNILAS